MREDFPCKEFKKVVEVAPGVIEEYDKYKHAGTGCQTFVELPFTMEEYEQWWEVVVKSKPPMKMDF